MPDSVTIEGDKLQVYLDRKMRAIGNAVLSRDKQNIYGDTIEYDVQNDELHVTGHARVESGDLALWGPELHMKLEDNVGEMKDASFSTNQASLRKQPEGTHAAVIASDYADPLSSHIIEDTASYAPKLGRPGEASRGDAKTLLFEGQNKKRLKDARYTTCEAGVDDWYIKASELELDDYTKRGTAKNARIEFKGVPILYTPWIDFSFVNQRKSGFLAPTIGTTSRSGFEAYVPYYWNIAPNMDATIGPRLLSKRGLQLQGEFRYMGETYSGIDNIEFLNDDNQNGENRYYAKLRHQQTLGRGWSFGYNLEKVSDDRYFADMSTRITSTSRINLPQQANIDYSDDIWRFSGLVQKYQTLDGLSYPYERLPQLTLTGEKEWGMVNTNLYTQWVHFDTNSEAPQSIVTGKRFTAYPSISLPFATSFGYITPKLGIHHTNYDLRNTAFTLDGLPAEYDSGNRTLPIFSIDSGLYFDRNVRIVKNRYTQTIEPRLFYVYIPHKDQSLFPIFDTAESDLNLGTLFQENQFTGGDRINNANQLSAAITTRLIDSRTGEQRLAATLGQRFYFTDQKVTMPGVKPRTGDNSDIVAAVTARLLNKWSVDAAWQYNTDNSQSIKTNFGARYHPEPGKVLNLSYRYTRDSLEQVNISGQWPLGKGWYGLGRWNYSLREGQPIEGLAGLEYDAGCWQARTVLQRVSTATANANYALFFQLELGGITSIGSNPLSLLKRGIPGYVSTGSIPDSYQQQSYE